MNDQVIFEVQKLKQRFQSEYLRNNRTNGCKNLRCFPACSFPSHCENGFCGQAVLLDLVIACNQPQHADSFEDFLASLIFVGEFQPCNEEFDGLPTEVDAAYLYKNLTSPTARFYIAQSEIEPFPPSNEPVDTPSPKSYYRTPSTKKYLIRLKMESKSWQYSWKSTRCTKDTQHAFVVSVLTPGGGPAAHSMDLALLSAAHATLRCLFQWHSPSFSLACVRRSDRSRPTTANKLFTLKMPSMAIQNPSTIIPLPGEEDDEQCVELSEAAMVTDEVSPLLRGAYLNLFSNYQYGSGNYNQEDNMQLSSQDG